jgi:hypothetical protein
MDIILDRIDPAPIITSDFDEQFLAWLWHLVDSLNENLSDIQNGLNTLTAPNLALLTETVTLTLGSPSFTVVDGTLYKVGYNVVGSGIPLNATIASIVLNVVTLDDNATSNGASLLTFIPTTGSVGNGIFFYDTSTNVYVGMQSGALVKFTTTAYP